MKMNKWLSLLLIFGVLTGCMSAQIKTSLDNLQKIQRIAVVPMEPPPLEIPPWLSSTSLLGTSASLVLIPESSVHAAGAVGVMLSGIFMLIELPEATKHSAKLAESIDSMLSSEEAWIPTVILAQEVADQLTSKGKYKVTLLPELIKFPEIQNRERTWHLENWYAPIRNWYSKESSFFDYKSLENQGIDSVLEIGLLNYCIARDGIVVQVMIKLISPSSGKVLGRARGVDYKNEKLDELFANNAQKFKTSFSILGEKLINEDLKYLGLLPE
jgi:hypothetical protein